LDALKTSDTRYRNRYGNYFSGHLWSGSIDVTEGQTPVRATDQSLNTAYIPSHTHLDFFSLVSVFCQALEEAANTGISTMASPPSRGSERSEPSSIYWGSDDSESPEPVEPRSHPYNTSNPPRLSSPRLFQDFFSSTARIDARLPTVSLQNPHPRPQDFPQAFENVNRAIQTAHQAFQSNQVVDLTHSPPRPSSESSMSHNRGRRDTAAYEYPSSPPTPSRMSSFRPGLPSELPPFRSTIASHNELADGEPVPKRRRIVHELDDTDEEEEAARAAARQDVEAVDLTDVNNAADLSKALSKQRQDAIQAQMKQNQGSEPAGRTPLTSYKCPICMDTPEDATTTTCGEPSLPPSFSPPGNKRLT
jgi:hypothetical protein